MNPLLSCLALLVGLGAFLVSVWLRLRLLAKAGVKGPRRLDHFWIRSRRVILEGFGQRRLRNYPLSGMAHQLVFFGFLVLLLRTVVLFGRGFDPSFNLWILGPDAWHGLPLGAIYACLKDIVTLLVMIGVVLFAYQRLVARSKRLSLTLEGCVILALIFLLMIADVTYEGALRRLAIGIGSACGANSEAELCRSVSQLLAPFAHSHQERSASGLANIEVGWAVEPLAAAAAWVLRHRDAAQLVALARAAYVLHFALVLGFLNILPYSKHFHVLTALLNIFFDDLGPDGRLKPIAASPDQLLDIVERAAESGTVETVALGKGDLSHLNWKDRLDLFSCTECGRCSDHCPAYLTGKQLDPKRLTMALRDAVYEQGKLPLLRGSNATADSGELVPNIIHPDVIWACTNCRACEEQCPVRIRYVDTIVDMRRHLVMIRGEVPSELARPFDAAEHNGNPWNLARKERSDWTRGMSVPRLAEVAKVDVLLWAGCAASYDPRAQRTIRSLVALLEQASVSFAILGDEENCTGDFARRAGNEYLFLKLAETNIRTLDKYQKGGRFDRIVSACPHCVTTLRHEYPDFGGRYRVQHHSELLEELLEDKRLQPQRPFTSSVAIHDACTLSRFADASRVPRDVLGAVPGLRLLEPKHSGRHGLCCGAGGAQMWLKEQNSQRMNVRRARELAATGATTVATSCPFCLTTVQDGALTGDASSTLQVSDIAELLAQSCGVDSPQRD